MKIDMNIDRLSPGKVKQDNNNQKFKGSKVKEPIIDTSSQSQNLSRNKALIDAVVINQIAQSFFQKAIVISSTLKSIASEAQTGGSIKGGELTDALNSINSSLNEIGTASQINYAQNNIVLHTGVTVSIPQIDNEVNVMKEFSNELSSGIANPDLKKIDIITESLTNKASQAADSIKQLNDAFPVPINIIESNSKEKAAELTQKTAADIIKLPQAAINYQGNISYASAKALL